MDVIKKKIESVLEIKKSKFITKIYPVSSLEEIRLILERLNDEYHDATHICYAYIFDGKIKCDDDGEPSGTAGYPILQVLEKQHLNHILAVVIRYFGGIKLGAGGLTRAYTSSVSTALQEKEVVALTDGYKIKLELTYDQTKEVDYLLKDINYIEKEYGQKVIYRFSVSKKDFSLFSLYSPTILENVLVVDE